MHLTVLLLPPLLIAVSGQEADDEWIDIYDMLNYDITAKTMRKGAEPNNYPNVPTKRREYTGDSSQAELTACNQHVVDLEKQKEEQQKKISLMSTQPRCNPVFKRFLSRLLKEVERVGPPSDSADAFYDAKIKVSKQTMTELRAVLEDKENGGTGPLDNALSQILVDLRQHDYQAWKWRFEDTFGVEVDTVLKMLLCVLVIVMVICTQLWSLVSWCLQFRRLFAVCFCISIVWNWLYLYKIAFAEHQNNIVKMDSVNAKCTGVKRIDWSDSLKEWFRSTWTLQDDPCKQYYEVLMVNPILLVPPTKAISVTITTFITEPLKHIGQGISEFLRALLKDLPVQLQIPVLLTIVLSILVVMYGGVNAAFQHGITAPFRRRGRRDPPPPALDQWRPQLRRIEGRDDSAGGDAPRNGQRHRDDEDGSNRNQLRRRRAVRGREQPGTAFVETLRNADGFSEDERDGEHSDASPEAEYSKNPSASESESENTQDSSEPAGQGSVSAAPPRAASEPSQSKATAVKGTRSPSEHERSRDGAPGRTQPSRAAAAPDPPAPTETQHHVQDPDRPAEGRRSVVSVETVGVPVQETTPEAAE